MKREIITFLTHRKTGKHYVRYKNPTQASNYYPTVTSRAQTAPSKGQARLQGTAPFRPIAHNSGIDRPGTPVDHHPPAIHAHLSAGHELRRIHPHYGLHPARECRLLLRT